MITFFGIEFKGTKNIALLHDGFKKFPIDKQSLIERIKNLRGYGVDVTEELKALKALNEVNE